MIDQTIVTFCICDEVTKTLNMVDDSQCKMTTSEIMTFALLSASLFGCNYKRTRVVARHHKYFDRILSQSQLNRRIHQIPEHVWMMVFTALQVFLRSSNQSVFIVDSFPVKAYENHKRFRARIFKEKSFHGYTASKKQYFFGIKVHMIVDADGVPIEFAFTSGSTSDIRALWTFNFDLKSKSLLLGDKAYTDYLLEDLLMEEKNLKLLPKRKTNSKRQHSYEDYLILKTYRNRVETVFSGITSRMPRNIKVRTEKGLYLKVMFFILAYMIERYCPLA